MDTDVWVGQPRPTTSGYYAWIRLPVSIHWREEERLELEIRAAHKRTYQTYGPKRLQRD